jgi:hypothetical protein
MRSLAVVLGLSAPVVIAHSFVLARAARLRSQAARGTIETAIRLDPENGYGYTIRAEYLERDGRLAEAEQAWREALRHDPRAAEYRIRLALLLEDRGDLAGSEACLLQAAAVSETWLPRWALVNFYARHGRREDCFRWARLALARAGDDMSGIFPGLEAAGASEAFILDRLLPRNRYVMLDYLGYCLRHSDSAAVEAAAMRLAALIPQSIPDWPGTEVRLWYRSIYPCEAAERETLLRAVDRLLDAGEPDAALRLWNVLGDRGIVSAGRWTANDPVVDARFTHRPLGTGLDWRIAAIDGVDIEVATEPGEMVVQLSGDQPETADLAWQRIYLPAGSSYRLDVESRTTGLGAENGLDWEIRDAAGRAVVQTVPVTPSAGWWRSRANVAASASGRELYLVLHCSRQFGAVRAEGTAEFRLVALERLP